MTRLVQTLLLIEDFAPDRELYRRCLLSDSEVAYSVLEAESVMAGLALCQESAIDAILLDYSLPDGTGIEFLQALHVQNNGISPPVVMLAGAGNERLAVQAIKLGAEDYLVKQDLTPELLQVTLRSAIENARLRLQLRQSDDRFRVSIENMLDCFGIFSAIRDASGQIIDFRFDYLNAAAMEDTQLTTADLGRGMCEVFPAHHKTGLFADYCRVVETGEPLVKENLVYSDTFGTQSLTRAYDVRASKLSHGLVISWRDVTERKQSELALQKANQQITEIWESMTDAYVTLDREWRVVYANSAATHVYWQLTGLEPEEFLGKSHWEIFPSLVGSFVEQAYRQAVTDQVAVHFEVFYEPTGDWFEAHAYPSTAGLGIYFRNISDRKQSEAIVQQQLAEIDAIYTTAPVGLCFIDTDLRFVRINEQLAEINGLPVCEHLGRTLREILPEMADQLEPLYRQVIESGEPILNLEVEGTNRARPGVLRHWCVCYYPQKDLHQRVIGVNVMVQEITDRKQVEAQLARMTGILHSVIEESSDVIFVKDLQGQYVVANQTAASWLETTPEMILGQDDTALFPPEVAEQIQQTDRQVLQTGESIVFEEEVPRQGVPRSLLSAKYPLRDAEGKILGVIGISRDISDHKEAELERSRLLAEAEAAREEAEAANRSKDEFIAIVAHELRSPLNSIQGWAKLLQTRKVNETTLTKALDTIVRNTEAQVRLVEDLLDISRLVRGNLSLTLTPVNLATVIESALNVVQLQANTKQIQLDPQLILPPQISGDFNRLQQIVVNLLTNAIKFTPIGGRVEVQLTAIASQVQLIVRDTGKGIAAEFLPQIFERFQQGQRNTGSKDGLGLGLAIVKNLVELHNGTIQAESPGLDQGATFTVRFPLLGTPAILQVSPTAIGTASLTGVRILIVDDEPDQIDLITFVLEEFGAQVQSATSAIAALDRLTQFNPDLLISDLAMPDGNGYELLQQVRSRPEGDIPAILLTAYASTTCEEKSLQAGFQRHLTKPVDPDVLITAIINLVDKSRCKA